jgi:hypothetical protein
MTPDETVDEKVLLSERRMEQETLIRWDRTAEPVTICTCYPQEWKILEKAGYRAVEVGYENEKIACKTFEIPRGQMRIRIIQGGKIRQHPSFGVLTARKTTSKSASQFHRATTARDVCENGETDAGKESDDVGRRDN